MGKRHRGSFERGSRGRRELGSVTERTAETLKTGKWSLWACGGKSQENGEK